jgi:hypothetical protein
MRGVKQRKQSAQILLALLDGMRCTSCTAL